MSNIIEKLLSPREIQVYLYIKEHTEEGKEKLRRSMKTIGEELEMSEATVHRAITKLTKYGSVGIVPSTDRFSTNAIQYLGEPTDIEDEELDEPFLQMIEEMNFRANRFKTIIANYQEKYEAAMVENHSLKEQLEELNATSKTKQKGNKEPLDATSFSYKGHTISPNSIVDVENLNEDYVAFIVKRDKQKQ